MITLQQFKDIFLHVETLEEKNQKLTDIMVCKDSCGWIDYSENIIDDIFLLLYDTFNIPKEDGLFEWWWYDSRDGNKYIYEKSSKNVKYNLNSLDNLYLYARRSYDTITEEYTDEEIKEHEKNLFKPLTQDEVNNLSKTIWG